MREHRWEIPQNVSQKMQKEENKIPFRRLAATGFASLALFSAGVAQADAAAKKPMRPPVACGPSTPTEKLPILTEKDRGSCVAYFQKLLVRHGDLAPSQVDGVFGKQTVGRTIGFQIQNNIKGTDGTLGTGNAGPLTWTAVRKKNSIHTLPEVCKDMDRGACVSKEDQATRLISNGKVIANLYSGFGNEAASDTRSDEGVFAVTHKVKDDVSRQFNNAEMIDSVYYNRGEALHRGDPNVLSHGCVHLAAPDALKAYTVLQSGDPVVVY